MTSWTLGEAMGAVGEAAAPVPRESIQDGEQPPWAPIQFDHFGRPAPPGVMMMSVKRQNGWV
jgi:hypothetical protein